MHYSETPQVDENILIIGIYKHGKLWDLKKKECPYDIHINSIQKCQYISPYTIFKLLKNPHKSLWKFKEIQEVKAEQWFLAVFKENAKRNLELISLKDVSMDNNEFYRLH